MDNKLVKGTLAEFLGTFTLVFVGAAAVVVAPLFGIVAPALGHGLVLVALIYAYGHFSGAQFNPAVTLGLLVGGKQDVMTSIVYMVAQFVGGIVAAFVLVALLGGGANSAVLPEAIAGSNFNFGQTTGFLTAPAVWQAAGVEAILAFLLVSTIYQAAVYQRAGNLAGVAIGFTLAALIFATGAMTGASVNPARTFGPALAAGDLSYVVPYFVGLFAGGAIAGLLHGYVLVPDDAS
ncbi:MAG: aquaporin [Anaerolineae bacterium]|nr:aquaporin [Anaerolineae bacterium]MCA9894117.1 aquaporin [Anaerolineae bacterium]